MSYQTENLSASSGNEIFDIPAAQEEVTLEQSENKQQDVVQSPMKRPKVIMLQKPSGISGFGMPPKAIKIVTVPGQGNGGKPVRAAVIPMNLLNRGLRIPGTTATNQGQRIVSPSQSRVLTLKTNQNTQQYGYSPYSSNRMDDSSDASMLDLGGHQHMSGGGQYIELGGNPPLSPQSKDDYNDLELNMNTPLKTNGLRRYARCVCNKVKEKGVTSYSEVADELVHEYAAEHPMIPSEQLHYIQKNIRRRVYDALNVLMALNVLQKEKKEIHWVGLPVNMIEECRRLEEEREKRQIALRNKTNDIQDLILQLIAFKNLIVRNKLNEKFKKTANITQNTGPTSKKIAGSKKIDEYLNNDRIPLPFLVVSTNKRTLVDANISEDKLQYTFTFDQPFEIRDDIDILKRMGLTLRLGTPQCQQEEFNQCLELVPPSMRFYVEAINARRQAIVPNFEALHQQRRLFVEARMAAATVPNEMGEGEPGTAGSGDPVKQIHFQHRGLSSGAGNSDYIPGDTQHYVRSAASRAFQGKTLGNNTQGNISSVRGSRHPPNVTSILSNSRSNMMNSSIEDENLIMDTEDGDMKLNESLNRDLGSSNSGPDVSRGEDSSEMRQQSNKQNSPLKRPGYQVRLTGNTPREIGHGTITADAMPDDEDDIEDMEDVDEDY